jgi:hypothetical protein
MRSTSIEEIFGQFFSPKKVRLLSLPKYMFGLQFGPFLTKASGQPGCDSTLATNGWGRSGQKILHH